MRSLWSCLLLVPLALHAEDTRPVNCRFLCFNATVGPTLIQTASRDVEVRCEVPVNDISQETRCFTKGNTLAFVDAADRQPAAVAQIPPEVKAALLIFLPAAQTADAPKTSALPWRVMVIEDSPGKYPDGGAFVTNFYAKDIRFTIGEHKNLLHRGGSHGIPRPETRDPFNMAPVVVEFQQEDDTWRTASESVIRFIPGVRYLIFAYVDPASGRPRISTIADIKPLVSPHPKK